MRRLALVILIGMVIVAMLTATTSRYIVRQSFVLNLELISPSPTSDLSSAPAEESSAPAADLVVVSDATASPQVLPAAFESDTPNAVMTSTAEEPGPTPSATITPKPTATATANTTTPVATATASVTTTASASATTAVEESPTVVPSASAQTNTTTQATASPSESISTPSALDSTANGESGP